MTSTIPAYGLQAFRYADHAVPRGYVCENCKRSGCKLWRPLVPTSRPLEPIPLRCADCACKTMGLDVARIDAKGHLPVRIGREIERIDQIGYWMPAIPTESGTDFLRPTVVSVEALAWWQRLPSRPA